MKVALAVFSRKGLQDTSVEDICLAAGYSKGGFYFHFRGKDDLLIQILEHGTDLVREKSYDALAAELWWQAGRNEQVRTRLVRRHERRRQELLHDAEMSGNDPKRAIGLLDLLLLLQTGLVVQRRFLPSTPVEAQGVVDSLLAALTTPAMEKGRGRRAGNMRR